MDVPTASPNDPAGIVRSLELPSGRIIRDMAISVDITHPWIGDLRVSLSPQEVHRSTFMTVRVEAPTT